MKSSCITDFLHFGTHVPLSGHTGLASKSSPRLLVSALKGHHSHTPDLSSSWHPESSTILGLISVLKDCYNNTLASQPDIASNLPQQPISTS